MQVITVDYTSSDAPAAFCESLKQTGFAVLSQHPINPALIQQSYNEWDDFFNSDEKYQFLYQKPSQAGYFPFKTENAKDKKVSDLKEFYHFYPWGPQPDKTKMLSQQLYQELTALAALLLQWVEEYLPANVRRSLSIPLREMIVDSPNTLLRILHYPPLSADIEPDAVRAAPHEDINLITLLPAATAPGLEVKDTSGNWHAVACDPGNIVVNVGDMLQMCTQHYYKSTTHRVVNPSTEGENRSRFSMPLFLHPRKEVLLSETQTAAEYLHERLKQIGIY